MSIFGQVWLWSLAAFFVGVLLTWLVLVLPLRKSVRKLESSLAQAHADAARTPANAAGLAAPGTEVFARPQPRPELEPSRQETSYPGTLVAAPPMSRGDVHDDIDEDFAELDSRVHPGTLPEPEPEEAYRPEPEEAYQPEPESESDDPYRSAATQFLTPVGEAEPADDPYRATATEYMVPDEEPEPESPALSRLEQKLDPEPAAGSLFQPPAAASTLRRRIGSTTSRRASGPRSRSRWSARATSASTPVRCARTSPKSQSRGRDAAVRVRR